MPITEEKEWVQPSAHDMLHGDVGGNFYPLKTKGWWAVPTP